MAAQLVILENDSPSAATWTDIYTVPSARRSRVIVTAVNRSTSAASEVRIALSPSGAAISDDHWIYHEDLAAYGAAETIVIVSASDVVRVYCENATISFTANGLEEDIPT